MLKKIKKLITHPFFSGSAIMIVGSNLANFFAYLYHLIIGRMLGPAGYGELASILSLVGLFSITFGFLGLVIVKFVSGMDEGEARSFFSWVTKRSLVAACAVSVILLLINGYLSTFLNVPVRSIILTVPLLFILFMSFIFTSFLQGLLRFGRLVVSSNFSLLGRLILGVLFVYLGFSVFGALAGVLLSSLLGLFLAVYFLKDYWRE
jgi:O-antigen/teichoic acid export membrane protein